MKPKFLFISPALFLLLFCSHSFAVQKTTDIFNDTGDDSTFETKAEVAGMCGEIDSKKQHELRWIYQKQEDKKTPHPIGILYLDDKGVKKICLDDLAFSTFVIKNVQGQEVSISGQITFGRKYDITHDKILIGNTLKVISDK